MKKILLTFLLPALLSSCDSIGIDKTSNVVDLTKKIKVEKAESIQLTSSHQDIHLPFGPTESYNISKTSIIAVPAIAKSIVYSLDQKGYVTAFSLKEKTVLWSKKLDSSNAENYNIGGILYSNDKLYVTNGSRELFVMSAITGEKILTKLFPDIIQTKPVMSDDKTVLVQTISNQLIAFDTEKLEVIWANEGELGIVSSRSHFSPFLANGYVITSYTSGELFCANPKNGDVKWVHSLSDKMTDLALFGSLSPTVISAKPVIKDEYIYIATSNSRLMKIKINTGDIIWQKNIEDIQSMTLSGAKLIITTNGRQVAVLSAQTGDINWVADLVNPSQKRSKVSTALFQAAFVVNDNNNQQSLNIIESNGELYSFKIDERGELNHLAKIITINKGVISYWISCCNNKLYLFNNKTVSF